MNKDVLNSLFGLQKDHAIDFEHDATNLTIKPKGIADTLNISDKNNEYTIFTNEWHEHFDELSELEGFLRALLSGSAAIVIKYRGSTAIAHQVQITRDGHTRIISRTGSFFSPFWRKKSFKVLKYEPF